MDSPQSTGPLSYSWDHLDIWPGQQQQHHQLQNHHHHQISPDCLPFPPVSHLSFVTGLPSPESIDQWSLNQAGHRSSTSSVPKIKHEKSESPKSLKPLITKPFSPGEVMEGQSPSVVKKRRRLPLSCEQCRRRKVKCDRSDPCENCVRSKTDCKYADDPRTAHIMATMQRKDRKSIGSISQVQHEKSPTASHHQLQLQMTQHQLHAAAAVESPEIQNLTERIQRMEKELAEATNHASNSRKNNDVLWFPANGKASVKGIFSKTKYYGQSHWINCGHQLKDILAIIDMHQKQSNSEISQLLEKCRSASKAIKTHSRIHLPLFDNLATYIPERNIADQLVRAYLRSFETLFRVLHVPNFLEAYERYWLDPNAAGQTFVIKLILIMAIGTIVHPVADGPETHESAAQWIYVAHSWLNTPFEKLHLTIEGLQIHCLLLIARQTSDVGGDLVWLSAGSLLRKAMHLGLHIDPQSSSAPQKTELEMQFHRKLWTTIVEIVLQSSMDSGGLPLLSDQDYDTKLPRNTCDIFCTTNLVPENPPDQFSEASLQLMLGRSQALRLEVAAFVNDFNIDHATYEKTIELSERLMEVLATNAKLFKIYEKHPNPPSKFQIKLMEILTHRFLLALHFPYAIKAKTDRTFYYSRKVGLETSLLLLSYTEPEASLELCDDYCRVRALGGALYKATPLLATMFIREELVDQLENEKYLNMTMVAQSRKELRQALEDYVELTASRVRNGETNVKGHIMASALLAHIDALQSGADMEHAVTAAVKESLEASYQMLRSRLDRTPSNRPTPLDTSSQTADTPGQSTWTNLELIDEWFSSDFQTMDWVQ